MKNYWKNKIQFLLVLLVITIASCSKKEEHAEYADTYTCSMHPTVISDKPGTCPICGMELVRKARPGEEVKVSEDLAQLIKSPSEVVLSSIKTVRLENKLIAPTVQAKGTVTYDTRNVYTIPARVAGRLDKIYLKYIFQPVSKGQKVADIYSPELVTAQKELLYLIENDPDNSQMIESGKNKLLLLGASEGQIKNLITRKEALNTLSIYSPYNGYLISDDQASTALSPVAKMGSTSSTMNDAMGGTTPSPSQPSASVRNASGFLIREGEYVATGQTLFKVVNTSSILVELDLPLSQAAAIKVGDEVDLDLGKEQLHKASVDFVQPFINENEDFVKLRIYLRDHKDLSIGQLVSAVIYPKTIASLWIPKQAVLDLGLDKIVFLKENNSFKPKKIFAGIQLNNWIEITSGLSESDEIAANAQFMVDSESFIKHSN
jgi:Cu(I)/Ag(I) efflux system membrane fusion protein